MERFVAMFLLFCRCRSFCPKGFGTGSFPAEYKIPSWPEDMSWDASAKLRTLTLGGFQHSELNEEYLEGPNSNFLMQGRETYWQASGQYFMYYCQRFRKWRIAEISAFSRNMDGECYAFVSDAYPNRDILNETLLRGFIEVENGQWATREDAGVVALGKLGDQMDTGVEEEESCQKEVGEESKCPVMPVVRKARDEALKVAKQAGKWARRLFPQYLGAPEEDDIMENPLFSSERLCDVKTLIGCSFKEQFFLEKQRNRSSEEQKSELRRLEGLETVVMKENQKLWLQRRLEILKQLTGES